MVIAVAYSAFSMQPNVEAQKTVLVSHALFTHSPVDSKSGSEDIGRLLNFKTIDPMGNRCAMIYGGPSLGLEGFLIQDCGGSGWTNKWNYDGEGFVKRMSFLSERIGWFVVGHGLVKVEKIDDALQATVIRNEPDQNIESVFFVNELYGWICGDNGMILKTDDGGVTWKRQNSNTDLRLNEIRFTNSLEGWATGREYRNGKSRGVLVTTRDGGTRWTRVKSKEAKNLSPVFFTSSHDGCGIDDNNSILCTNDGQNWRQVFSDKVGPKIKTAMFFSSENEGWVVGDGIWHTGDGGETWIEQLALSDGSHEFRSVVFLNDRLGWAQSLDAVWRTRNGGETWSRISDTWIKRLNSKTSAVSAHRFIPTPPTSESRSAKVRNPRPR